MSLLQAGARSPRRRLLLSYREKNILYSFFPPTQRGNPRARRARSTRRGMRVERVPRTGSGSLARSFIRSIDRSCVRALTMRHEYEHVLIPSEDGSARAGPATLLNDGETDATRTADRARIFSHELGRRVPSGRSVGLDESRLESSVPLLYIHARMSKRRSDCGGKDAPCR